MPVDLPCVYGFRSRPFKWVMTVPVCCVNWKWCTSECNRGWTSKRAADMGTPQSCVLCLNNVSIQALCSAGLRLDVLVRASPFFPAQTLVLVSQMVDAGSLISAEIDTEMDRT